MQLQKMSIEKAWLMNLGFRTVKALNDFRNLLKNQESTGGSLRVADIGFFDERIEEFWGRISEHYDFMVVRDRDYLNWRYRDPRGGNFFVRQVEEGGRVLGYSVLRINRYHEDYPVGYVVDILTLPDRLDVADALVADAVRFFDDENVNITLSMVVKRHPYEKCFGRWGFIDSHVRLNLLYTVLGIGDEVARLKRVSASKIYFSYGDIDSLPAEMPRLR